MLVTKEVYASLKGPYMRHYESLGYEIPRIKKQRYYRGVYGNLCKAGTVLTTENAKILVKVSDLPPTSHYPIIYKCDKCGDEIQVEYGNYMKCKKEKDLCVKCTRKKDKLLCQASWVRNLITDNMDAKCDICGETDKRFLVVHHLEGRKDEHNDERFNYVVISANYHNAFHKYLGTTRVRSTREKYKEFKQQELEKLRKEQEYGNKSLRT